MPLSSRMLVLAGSLAVAAAGPTRAQALFDAPYRYFPTDAPVYSVAAGRLGPDSTAYAVVSHPDRKSLEILAADARGDFHSRAIITVGNRPR